MKRRIRPIRDAAELTHEETLAYALKAGQEPEFTKEQTRAMVKADFDSVQQDQSPRKSSFRKLV